MSGKQGSPLIINIGDKYNKLTVIKEVIRTSKYRRRFLFKCDCDNIKEIDLISVTRGMTVSCGCVKLKNSRNQPKGKNSPSWKGGEIIDGGYKFIYNPEHKNSKSNGYIREHTLVMSNKLGRPLDKGENVHHINGNKLDNRIENLELWSTSQPCGQKIGDKLKWAREIIRNYEEKRYE